MQLLQLLELNITSFTSCGAHITHDDRTIAAFAPNFTAAWAASLVDEVADAGAQWRQPLRCEAVGVDCTLGLIKLLFVLPKAARVVGLKREASTRAGGRNLKLVDDLLPELVLSDALETTAQNGSFEQLA